MIVNHTDYFLYRVSNIVNNRLTLNC